MGVGSISDPRAGASSSRAGVAGLGAPRDRAGRAIDLGPVRPLLVRIVSEWDPEQIWLFGSRARGDASPDGDWDLLVVVPDQHPGRAADPLAAWRLQKGAGVPADVVLCPASEFRDARDTPNTLAFEATRSGVLLHER